MKFEDFQKKVIDVTNTVGKKTNDLIEEGKLLYKIRETEREIDRLYQDLGRAVYEADEDMEVSFEEYTSDKTEQIDSQKEKLAELRGALADLKGDGNASTLTKDSEHLSHIRTPRFHHSNYYRGRRHTRQCSRAGAWDSLRSCHHRRSSCPRERFSPL